MPTLVHVTAENVDKTGFFCKMSGKKTPGYQRELAWLKQRFAEGLDIRMLGEGERGFIETIPGEHAWRAVNAEGYLVIHCLWVVGRSKGKGYGMQLVEETLARAESEGFKGVAAVTSRSHWLISADILERHGFENVAAARPSFDLLVKKFDTGHADPSFCGGWDEKQSAHGEGLAVYRTDQCPYLDDAVKHAESFARERGFPFKTIELTSAADVRALSPTPYGVFAIVKDGMLLAYHYLLKKDFEKLIGAG